MMTQPPRPSTHLIIERPDWQTRRQRVVYGSLTAMGWALWGFLWLPLLTAVGWLGEAFFAWHHMVQLDGFSAFRHLAASYSGALVVLGGIFVGWASYNYLRFRGYDRRRPRPTVTDHDLADAYHVPESDVARWHASRRLVVWHDEQGQVVRVQTDPPPQHEIVPEPAPVV
ncbi:poly-beta-1,6-N-acetyl-D-glucosamine biosynthesis protein PgaD [Silvimonas soli]|uniref:poly-beta-1,6-N-acetyl-D-glucosamine biosynthesis protein PgaD n=1 Tax=Silvimonas soli TaxID=2980100 RepID=UPI0024B33C29|nr:poly-beta-1,6-N-acetyl-D-glucosamine biosynthesis protein PgaD [Silvimonas soli]